MITSDEYNVYVQNIRPSDAELLSGVYLKSKRAYKIPKNLHSLREVYKFTKNETLVSLGNEEKQKLEQIKQLKNGTKVFDPRLREYQNQDVEYLSSVEYAGVFLEPRMGKTPIMIKTIEAIGSKKNLIVCPSSLVYNWSKECQNWSNSLEVHPVSGTPKQREKVYKMFTESKNKRVLIISKDTLKMDIEKLGISFDSVIVDEAHFLRNYKTAQSEAIYKIKAKRRFALTGTPTSKHSSDIYGILHFLNPKQFTSYWQFVERYFVVEENYWGGKQVGAVKSYREQELLGLMDSLSTMRKRKDYMRWLPKEQHQKLPVMMEGKQLRLYNQMKEMFMAGLETEEDPEVMKVVDAMSVLAQLMRLRQLCLDPRLLGFEVVGAKTKALLEFAEDNNEPFIVMTTFSSYFKLVKQDLEKLGKKVGIIDGSISKQQKMATAEAFQKGKIDILLCNIIAAGTGFTLDRADTIVFLDKDFNPANNEQAQDRIVPTTKDRYHNINIISLVCAGSVDERVNEILENKEDLTKLINKPEMFAY